MLSEETIIELKNSKLKLVDKRDSFGSGIFKIKTLQYTQVLRTRIHFTKSRTFMNRWAQLCRAHQVRRFSFALALGSLLHRYLHCPF